MRKGMFKRFLAVVLSSAMVLSTTAFAEDSSFADTAFVEETAALEALSQEMETSVEEVTGEDDLFFEETDSEKTDEMTELPEEKEEEAVEEPSAEEEEQVPEETVVPAEEEEQVLFEDGAEDEVLLNAGGLEITVNAKGKNVIRFKKADGSYLKNDWKTIDGEMYYFNEKGIALVGIVKKLTGPKGTEGIYYFQDNGQVYKKGFAEVKIKGETAYYYFAKNGQAYTNALRTATVDGQKEFYYFLANGKAFTSGLRGVEVNGEKQYYYFQKNGKAVKNALITNVKVGEKTYQMFFQKNGTAAKNALKKLTVAGKSYYYYFQANGTASVSKIQPVVGSDGVTYYYYFDASAHAITGKWITREEGGEQRVYAYAYGNGRLATGCASINGKVHHFSSTGVVQAGWFEFDGTMAYFQGDTAEFYIASTPMYNAWLRIRNESSGSSYYICTDLSAVHVFIFVGSAGAWKPLYSMICSPGAAETPTVTGHFTVQSRGYSFGSTTYTCYYYTQFYGNYLFHSVLYDADTFNIQDGRLGEYLSHGCIRMDINDAKWIYDNIPEGTDVEVYW